MPLKKLIPKTICLLRSTSSPDIDDEAMADAVVDTAEATDVTGVVATNSSYLSLAAFTLTYTA
jgi:hypothetical protein